MSLRAGRSGHYGEYFESIEPGHRGIATQIPRDVDDALTEWCKRAGETKRDVLAAMVAYFLDNETAFELLLDELREVPRRV